MKEDIINSLRDVYIREDKSDVILNKELPFLKPILKSLENHISDNYEIIEAIGRGGTGIVFKIRDKHLDIFRALKLPRPTEEKIIESVKNEIENLNNIRHENIINIYSLGDLEVEHLKTTYPFFIMDYIKNARDLKKAIKIKLEEYQESQDIKQITRWLCNIMYSIAKALCVCHSKNIIHFDIKPSNILIDENEKPILTDLGFAKKKTDSDEETVIGFTIFYAHIDLKDMYEHQSSKNRVRKKEKPKNFNFLWDLYSFGKTTLELLDIIHQQFPDTVLYDYTFSYLHLASCRMLDGCNLDNESIGRIRKKLNQDGEDFSVFKETWLELGAKEFKEIKYNNFIDVVNDLEKIIYHDSFINKIPELHANINKRIQVATGIPAPFTYRVKRIVEHPVFARLTKLPQLDLTNSIYPTATHNRLEHSLGVFRNCCIYISTLYDDYYNPIFKQLVNEKDLMALLVASLIHDIGHYPFAHEIENILKNLNHEEITIKLLENPTKDKFGNTLKEIIENKEWGWDIEINSIKAILTGQKPKKQLFTKTDIKTKMLSAIIDGPIDVDKLDYLLRDSQNCYLRYGESIDFDRLIRSLTIILFKDQDNEINLTIGTYEKGQSAAESLTFARYLLYQSVYWHHTSRSLRVMLKTAINNAVKLNSQKVRNKLDVNKEFKKYLKIEDEMVPISQEDVLNFFNKITNQSGKKLINDIILRNYYKRLITVHFEVSKSEGKQLTFLDKFRNAAYKIGFNDKLQKEIRSSYLEFISHTSLPKLSLLAPNITDETLTILNTPDQILCDTPNPNFGSEDNYLRFIPEPQRLQKNYYAREEAGNRISDVWQQVHFSLMNIAAKGRVFCNPHIRDNILAALSPKELYKILEKVVIEFSYK